MISFLEFFSLYPHAMESVYFWGILAFLIGFYVLDLVAEWLNLSALQPDLPARFADVFDAERYRQSQEYTRTNTRFGWVSSTVSLAVMLAVWLLGGFNTIDQLARGWFSNPILAGLAFFGVLFIGQKIISLPFEIYHTFVIEQKFGFNKTTPKLFIQDQIRDLVLMAALGIPLGAVVLAFFEYAGPLAWLWGWLVLTGFSLIISYVYPSIIMPMYNKFTPVEGELHEQLMAYAQKVKFPLTGVFVMDGSKRSTKSNAIFTGIGNNKKVVLYDTLIANHSTSELIGVLAHEIGHYKLKHIPQVIVFSILSTGVMFFLAGFFMKNADLHAAFGMEQVSVYASLLFFSLLISPLNKVLSVLSAIWSRKNEFEADAFAARTTGSATPLITALKALSKNNLSNLTPHPFYVFLNHSHPPMLIRLAALDREEQRLASSRAAEPALA